VPSKERGSVQHRRILRRKGLNGQETIVAGEDDKISSVAIRVSDIVHEAPAPAPTVVVNTGSAYGTGAPAFGQRQP
jgi:hypothetical protein